ncbi:MAG TPA: hypothetical protein VGC42_03190 [Kofleriaceae bacterium]
MRALLAFAILAAGCAGAHHNLDPRPYPGKLPPGSQLDMAGSFTLSPAGDLSLALASPCVVGKPAEAGVPNSQLDDRPCTRAQLDGIPVVARTPWHQDLRGAWLDPQHLSFHVDWLATGIDPLGDDTAAVLAGPWALPGTTWTPSQAEAAQLLDLLGAATATEATLVKGGAPPKLDAAFEIAEGPLRLGEPATLVVKIANHGAGIAYRVIATTRSSIAALHGQKLEFGMIKPGAEKSRTLSVTVPRGETAPDTMLVLVLAEGNVNAPGNLNRRIAIGAALAPPPPAEPPPPLAVHCAVAGHKSEDRERAEVEAGGSITLKCTADNGGKKPIRVELEAQGGSGPPVKARPFTVAAGGSGAAEVAIAIPRDLAIDSNLDVAITARSKRDKLEAKASAALVIRKRKLCVPGQLTRAQYQAKLTELRAAVAAGDMTQVQLDRYDAELTACLK